MKYSIRLILHNFIGTVFARNKIVERLKKKSILASLNLRTADTIQGNSVLVKHVDSDHLFVKKMMECLIA